MGRTVERSWDVSSIYRQGYLGQKKRKTWGQRKELYLVGMKRIYLEKKKRNFLGDKVTWRERKIKEIKNKRLLGKQGNDEKIIK